MEKGKLIDTQWKENKLNYLINVCLNIENNIKDINKINETIKKNNSLNISLNFYPNEEGINEILKKIKQFGIINENGNYYNKFDSKIEFDENLVKSWLNNRNFISELLFRKTRDGSTPNDFHNKCNNKGITIVFIETTKGYKFGGYTELQWDKSGYKKDNSAFIFSFNKKQKYLARNNNYSIKGRSDDGPRFGSGSHPEIFLFLSLNKGQSFDDSSGNTFLLGRQLTNGEEYWDVKELEVH